MIQNTSDEPNRIFGQVIEFSNTDGQKAQFCIIDACYENLIEGNLYPSNGGVFPIDGNNGFNDYFANLDETNLVEYKFRIFQADVDSGEEIEGSSFYLTYIFDEDADMNITEDRKSTRLNSSHVAISYAVFCLKTKTQHTCNGQS